MAKNKTITINKAIAHYVAYPKESLCRETTIEYLIDSGLLIEIDIDNEEGIFLDKNLFESEDFDIQKDFLPQIHKILNVEFGYFPTGEKVKIAYYELDGFIAFYFDDIIIITELKDRLESYLELLEKSLYKFPVKCFQEVK